MVHEMDWIRDIRDRLDGVSLPGVPMRERGGAVPSRTEVNNMLADMLAVMFPVYYSGVRHHPAEGVGRAPDTGDAVLASLYGRLRDQIATALTFHGEEAPVATVRAETLARTLLTRLPEVKEVLLTDVQALYEGDPAAISADEVLLSYPGFYAIAVYRLAHEFYREGIPYLPRLMTEHAHSITGIDIHAGATVGRYFFIDHGTGTVIGETTTIGDHVKIYQGVTLGARSFELDERGNPVKGIKRHPDIGDRVVIYANATILGGNTRVGDDCVIGGNVFLTRSVPAGETVYYRAPSHRHRDGE